MIRCVGVSIGSKSRRIGIDNVVENRQDISFLLNRYFMLVKKLMNKRFEGHIGIVVFVSRLLGWRQRFMGCERDACIGSIVCIWVVVNLLLNEFRDEMTHGIEIIWGDRWEGSVGQAQVKNRHDIVEDLVFFC